MALWYALSFVEEDLNFTLGLLFVVVVSCCLFLLFIVCCSCCSCCSCFSCTVVVVVLLLLFFICCCCSNLFNTHAHQVRGKHYVYLSAANNALHRQQQQRVVGSLQPFFASANSVSLPSFSAASALSADLPANVELLTLEALNSSIIFARFSHSYAAGEDASLSRPVTVSLSGLFAQFKVLAATEVSLTGNALQTKKNRLRFMTEDHADIDAVTQTKRHQQQANQLHPPIDSSDLSFVLQPMQIRAFEIVVQRM